MDLARMNWKDWNNCFQHWNFDLEMEKRSVCPSPFKGCLIYASDIQPFCYDSINFQSEFTFLPYNF